MTLRRWMAVRVRTRSSLTVAEGTTGRVVRIDRKRSTAGFDTLVCWHEKLGAHRRSTWVPSACLEPAA